MHGSVGGDHAGRQLHQVVDVASGERHFRDHAGIDDLTEAGGAGFEHGSFRGDRYAVTGCAHLERDVQLDDIADTQDDAGPRVLPETREIGVEDVGAREQVRELIKAFPVGLCLRCNACSD